MKINKPKPHNTLLAKLTHLHRKDYCHLCNKNFKGQRGLSYHNRLMHSKVTAHAIIVLLITVGIGFYSSQAQATEFISPTSVRLGEGAVATGAVDPTQAPVPSATATPAPTNTPTPTKKPKLTYHNAEIEAKIRKVFGDDELGDLFVKIAFCESSLNPIAESTISSATGLFQILSVLHNIPKSTLLDPDENIRIAYDFYQRSGTKPWNASKHCWGE